MKNICITLFFLLSMSFKAHAQFSYLNKLYNNHGWWDNSYGIVDLGNYYLTAGTTIDLLATDSTRFSSLWVHYVDSAGNMGAEREIGIPNMYIGVGGAGLGHSILTQTKDGEFLFCGTIADTAKHTGIFLIKLDSSLGTKWIAIDTGKGYTIPYDLVQLSDSGFIVCGYSMPTYQSTLNGFLSRFDKNGNHLWSKFYYNPQNENFLRLILTSGDSILFTTATASEGFLAKVDSAGSLVWKKKFTIGNSGFCMKKSKYADYITFGAHGSINNYYGFVARVNDNAQVLWMDTIRLGRFSSFIDAFELPGGNIIAVGRTDGNSSTVGWAAKFGRDGGLLYEKVYRTKWSNMWGASATSDGGIVCVGTADNDYESPPYGQDAWVLKLDTNLCDTPNCYPGVGIKEPKEAGDLLVYPNPFSNEVNIAYRLPSNEDSNVRVYSVQGVLIKETKLNHAKDNLQIDMSGMAPGLYILQLVQNNTVVKTQKLLRQP